MVPIGRLFKKLAILFPLKEHSIHKIISLHAVEKYDHNRYVKEYHYKWNRIIPKEGFAYAHISAWKNESHDAPNTPEEYIVATDPHHQILSNRKHRIENHDIRTFESAFKFIAKYVDTVDKYKPEF